MIADDVRELVELFNGSDLTELSIERGGRKLHLRKGQEAVVPAPEPDSEPASSEMAALKAHMVGTFYWNKDKKGKPAVALEQQVEKGRIVGYIEAMGIMNELEAMAAGKVVEIAASSGQPVEYGQTLIVLQPG